MFCKNLKYYRLKNNLTKKQLAEKAKVSSMAITNYENGNRMPNMEIINRLAQVLNVRISDFLAVRNENLVFKHGEFRKNSSLSQSQQEYVRECVEEYFGRFMTIVEILGGDVLPDAPSCYVLPLTDDDEENAQALREHLGFAAEGPIEDLIGKLENKGILVYPCDPGNTKFSGMNGFVNDRPFIVYNPTTHAERNRTTIGHELAHLMFKWPEDMDEKKAEDKATSISGAFLFPKNDAQRELGVRRSAVTPDMKNVAREYGISMLLLVKRAEISGIISDSEGRKFYIMAGQRGWRGSNSTEPSRIPLEKPTLFIQLVCRAIAEDEISIQRGAELLNCPYQELVNMCSYLEVY